MSSILANIKGDKVIWAIAFILALFSFMPVYSASSNLAYLYSDGNTLSYLLKHALHLFLGFGLMYVAHKINYKYYNGLSVLLVPVAVVLLIYTLTQGTTIGNANAARWIRIPLVGMTFQTSSFASVVLLIYVARYLAKTHDKNISFKQSILPLLGPIALICGLILPANFSTAAILFFMCLVLMFVGGYKLKHLGIIVASGIGGLALFILLVMAFPNISNRVETWKSRIENFSSGDPQENYQVEKAQIAIAQGGLWGKGPGKSTQKNFLPQSSSDFIYAVIIEEWGLIGGLSIIFFYLLLMMRILSIATKTRGTFGSLLVVAVGFSIIFQAFINMGVAVHLFPVTGQTLPLISAGGSSIWMTCIGIGIVLSVSKSIDNPETIKEPIHGEAVTA